MSTQNKFECMLGVHDWGFPHIIYSTKYYCVCIKECCICGKIEETDINNVWIIEKPKTFNRVFLNDPYNTK